MIHFASGQFWACYAALPEEIRNQADKQFALLKANPSHPSLKLKKVGRFRSVRVSLQVRALAVEDGGDLIWFWIGEHSEYERLIKRA